MRHSPRFDEPAFSSRRPLSARRRRWLRWVFAVIFAAAATAAPGGARQIPFAPKAPISTATSGAMSVSVADIDGDGDLDVVSGSRDDNTIGWHENSDGAGSFASRQVISTATIGPRAVFAADLDGDGDVDVVSAAGGGDTIGWHENSDGDGNFSSVQIISTATDFPFSVFAADVDGDGDMDVLSASSSDNKIAWYENSDGTGNFASQQVISFLATSGRSVFAADVDGDGDLDVLSAAASNDEIAWYENSDGAGSFGPLQTITTAADQARSVFACDVDGDGDLDALSASPGDSKIAWYINVNGSGGFSGIPQIISTAAGGARSVYCHDLDGDGDLDVVAAAYSDSEIVWYENSDAAGSFTSEQTISTLASGAYSIVVGDLDGDGDLDVVSAAFAGDEVAWYENETIHRSAAFPTRSVIYDGVDRPFSVVSADVDGDGDLDILSASRDDDVLAWYENSDGAGSFGSQQVISTANDGAYALVAADLDGDGDVDVAAVSVHDDELAWYENSDGAGSFGSQQIVSTAGDRPLAIAAADLDGDGDLDLLAGSTSDDEVAWYENSDGAGSFGSQQVISTAANGPHWVGAADLDGDGDLDVLSASLQDDMIAWYENSDGGGGFSPQQIISTAANGAESAFATDIDGDGDLDVVSASTYDDKVAWYENTDGAGTFGPEQILSTSADRARSVFAADLDGDGDIDLLSASLFDDEIAWYENTGGGTFGTPQLVSSAADRPLSVVAADIDGDGDIDIVSSSYYDFQLAWYENRGGQFALATADVAQGVAANSELHDLLKIVVTHRGRAGDSEVELASLELRFTDGAGTALTEAQVAALIQTLRFYADDGATGGAFDGADTLVASTTDFSSITGNGDGVMAFALPDGDPNLQVAHGSPGTYFLAAELTAGAESQSPAAFDVEHRTESSTEGEDAAADLPLILEFAANVSSGTVDTAFSSASCQAPFDLLLEERTVSTTVTCTAGTSLTAGSGVSVVTAGDLTLRAGQSIALDDGFEVDGGAFTAEIDPALEP